MFYKQNIDDIYLPVYLFYLHSNVNQYYLNFVKKYLRVSLIEVYSVNVSKNLQN